MRNDSEFGSVDCRRFAIKARPYRPTNAFHEMLTWRTSMLAETMTIGVGVRSYLTWLPSKKPSTLGHLGFPVATTSVAAAWCPFDRLATVSSPLSDALDLRIRASTATGSPPCARISAIRTRIMRAHKRAVCNGSEFRFVLIRRSFHQMAIGAASMPRILSCSFSILSSRLPCSFLQAL